MNAVVEGSQGGQPELADAAEWLQASIDSWLPERSTERSLKSRTFMIIIALSVIRAVHHRRAWDVNC
jgi:hypothetical protein